MGVSPGEESLINGVAAQTIEAQPVFGQIKPSKRPRASRAEPQSREKRLASLGLDAQEVGIFRRKERNVMQETAGLSADRLPRAKGLAIGSMWAGGETT